MIRLSLIGLAIFITFGSGALLDAAFNKAVAQCGPGDFVCEKFSRKETAGTSTRQRNRPARVRRNVRRPRQTSAVSPKPVKSEPASADISSERASNTPTRPALVISSPPTEVVTLEPGAIDESPRDLPNLFFGSGDRVELATAKCHPTERSDRRVTCSVAVHQLALTSEAGAGCTGSLTLRDIEFAKNEEGGWVNEDSIALCGGRLLRRSELIPVSVDGTPRYALSEEFQLLGGDRVCAAPYLRSRRPLRKSYLPTGNRQGRQLRCGSVAAR